MPSRNLQGWSSTCAGSDQNRWVWWDPTLEQHGDKSGRLHENPKNQDMISRNSQVPAWVWRIKRRSWLNGSEVEFRAECGVLLGWVLHRFVCQGEVEVLYTYWLLSSLKEFSLDSDSFCSDLFFWVLLLCGGWHHHIRSSPTSHNHRSLLLGSTKATRYPVLPHHFKQFNLLGNNI